MNAFEQPLPNVENPEVRRYEYKDATGKTIANVEAAYERTSESVPAPWNPDEMIPVRKLSVWSVTNPETGEAFDMLAEFNTSNAQVLVPDARTKNYSFDFFSGNVVVPPPESPVDVANILHELGHADQYADEAYDAFVAGAPISNQFLMGREDRKAVAVSQLDYVLKALPEVAPYVPEEAARKLRDATTPEEVLEAAKELKDILALPSRMLERDANRRALSALRKLRDRIGVNLLKDTLNPPEALMSGAEGCTQASAEALASSDRDDLVVAATPDQLRKDLSSYGAVQFRIGKEKDGGIMPSI